MTEQTPAPEPTAPAAQAPAETAKAEETKQTEPPQSFSQEEVDRILADRLRRAKPADYDEAKQKAKQFDEWQETQKSEQERIAERQAAIERERDDARAESLRFKAAATHGLGEDYFDLLGSGDEQTISARAERVGGLVKENAQMKAELEALRAGKPAPTSGTPVTALKPGATPESAQTEDDVLYNSLFTS